MANLIKSIKVKTCALDPLSASVLSKCLPTLLPAITDMVNRSLEEDFMPNAVNCAMIILLLKKSNLHSEEFKS